MGALTSIALDRDTRRWWATAGNTRYPTFVPRSALQCRDSAYHLSPTIGSEGVVEDQLGQVPLSFHPAATAPRYGLPQAAVVVGYIGLPFLFSLLP